MTAEHCQVAAIFVFILLGFFTVDDVYHCQIKFFLWTCFCDLMAENSIGKLPTKSAAAGCCPPMALRWRSSTRDRMEAPPVKYLNACPPDRLWPGA